VRFTINSAERLDGPLDHEALIAAFPVSYTVKGMFFSRIIEALGSEWPKLEPQLLAAPRLGRYVPFSDYPQADYLRLFVALAHKRFPRMSPREAVRRVARDDLETFAGSVIGKVVLALAGDARTTLLRVPDAFARVTKGGFVSARELDERTVRLEFESFRGCTEYTLGQIEGIVLHYGSMPTVSSEELAPGHRVFDVTH
jgi:uncharacterized protein (TIGR02265 family)